MITRDWFIRHEVFIIAARHWFPATDMKIASLINYPDRKEYTAITRHRNGLISKLNWLICYNLWEKSNASTSQISFSGEKYNCVLRRKNNLRSMVM